MRKVERGTRNAELPELGTRKSEYGTVVPPPVPPCGEIPQRHGSLFLRDCQQALQDPRRRHRVRPRAMPPRDLEPEVVRQRIEAAARERGQEAPGESHGAHSRPLQEERAGAKQL